MILLPSLESSYNYRHTPSPFTFNIWLFYLYYVFSTSHLDDLNYRIYFLVFTAEILKLQRVSKFLGGHVKQKFLLSPPTSRVSGSVGLRWDPRMYMPDTFPGVVPVGLGRGAWLRTTALNCFCHSFCTHSQGIVPSGGASFLKSLY
jgi:hypothetical protein